MAAAIRPSKLMIERLSAEGIQGWDQIGLLWSSPLPVRVVDDQELINDCLDPLGRIDGAELCLHVLELLGEKLIN